MGTTKGVSAFGRLNCATDRRIVQAD